MPKNKIVNVQAINQINDNKKLNAKQKKVIIENFGKPSDTPDEFLNSFFPASQEQFLEGFGFFPFAVKEDALCFLIDLQLAERIHSLPVETRYRNLALSYLQQSKKRENKYALVGRTISKLWTQSSKNPRMLKNSPKFEKVLQNIPDMKYRDHFIHSLYVFLMGHYIINRLTESHDFNSTDVNLTWMLTSTFHDIAYPIERIHPLLNSVLGYFMGTKTKNYIDIKAILPEIYYDFMRHICSFNQNPIVRAHSIDIRSYDLPLYKRLKLELIKKNHGVLSALILANDLAVRQRFLNYGDGENFFNMHLPACHAICLHAIKEERINFETHPFAFLLVLCDELQDWGRPSQQEARNNICKRY